MLAKPCKYAVQGDILCHSCLPRSDSLPSAPLGVMVAHDIRGQGEYPLSLILALVE